MLPLLGRSGLARIASAQHLLLGRLTGWLAVWRAHLAACFVLFSTRPRNNTLFDQNRTSISIQFESDGARSRDPFSHKSSSIPQMSGIPAFFGLAQTQSSSFRNGKFGLVQRTQPPTRIFGSYCSSWIRLRAKIDDRVDFTVGAHKKPLPRDVLTPRPPVLHEQVR